jgi:predicted DNA-binding transcriptional regulator AlpA
MKSEKQTDENNQRLISQAKAAEMCGMTRAAIHNLVRRGRFGSIEVEGRNLVYLEEIEAFAVEHESTGGHARN